mgnify:CR=1 FL=1
MSLLRSVRDPYLPPDHDAFVAAGATRRIIVIAPTRAACETIELAFTLDLETVLWRERGAELAITREQPVFGAHRERAPEDGRLFAERSDVKADSTLALERDHPLVEAFVRADAVQCGFCTPGQIVSAAALVAEDPHPDRDAIRHGMAGNLCRCGTYSKIEEAIRTWHG